MYFFEFLVNGVFVVDDLLVLGGHFILDALLDGLLRIGDLLFVVAFDLAQLPLEIVEHLCLTRAVLQHPRLQFCLLFQRLFQCLQTTPIQSTRQIQSNPLHISLKTKSRCIYLVIWLIIYSYKLSVQKFRYD